MRAPKHQTYDSDFYADQQHDSYLSAKAVLPLLQAAIAPQSVVDVGCGVGTWLRAWREIGTRSIFGIDGDYVLTSGLQIPESDFSAMDLTRPQSIGSRYDLAESLEVAEHLPPHAARPFVDFLCSLAPVVLFGAAIPFQGGTAHLNERWPEYWAGMFFANGYEVFDLIRPAIWTNPNVKFWYAQNTFIYVQRDQLHKYPNLSGRKSQFRHLARLHPGHLGRKSKAAYVLHRAFSWPATVAVRGFRRVAAGG